MLAIIFMIVCLALMAFPLVNVHFRWFDSFKVTSVCGSIFAAIVIGLIVFRVIFVEPVVPKVRYSHGPIQSWVCDDLDVDQLEKMRQDTLPNCEIEWIIDQDCSCTRFGKQTADPDGRVEFVLSPLDENGETDWTVRTTEQTWIDETGEKIPVGELRGACVRTSKIPEVMRHELIHVCGYHHVIGDPLSTNVAHHAASPTLESVGDDVRGLDLAHDSLYIPE